MVQTVCDKPLEQGRQDINVERTFYDAFMLSDWSIHYRLVRVELSSSLRADSLPFTVGNVYAVIKHEVDALTQLGEYVSADSLRQVAHAWHACYGAEVAKVFP